MAREIGPREKQLREMREASQGPRRSVAPAAVVPKLREEISKPKKAKKRKGRL